MRRFHFWATVVWATVGLAATAWLRSSIPWLAFMSLYAIVVSHWSAYQGARGEERVIADARATAVGRVQDDA